LLRIQERTLVDLKRIEAAQDSEFYVSAGVLAGASSEFARCTRPANNSVIWSALWITVAGAK
jgi:hypothetical protein